MNPKRKFFLFHQSQHFCSVPWNHFEVFSDGRVRTCSKGQFLGNINQVPLHEILQGSDLVSIKQDLLSDVLHHNCTGCHKLSTGQAHTDLRNHYNPMFKKFDIDYEDVTAFELHGIDLHWDNTCNFRCVYCNAKQSSSIAQEQGTFVTRNDKDNIDRIIDLIVQNQYQMKEIYFSGGEPLLIKQNAQLLKGIDNVDLPIRINSNISKVSEQNPVFAELRRFRNVLWTVSADNQGARFEYIRHGSRWSEFLKNLEVIKNTGHQVRLNMVWFAPTVLDLPDTIRYFVQQHSITDITINQLQEHAYLRARHAPESVKQQALIDLSDLLTSGLVPSESNAWYNIARCTQELKLPGDSQGLQQYFDHLDQLRGTNWRSVFPELAV